VSEALGHHVAGGHFLEAVIADGRRGAQCLVHIAGIELDPALLRAPGLGRFMSPHSRKTVRLQLERD
jgi:hypothetical protein